MLTDVCKNYLHFCLYPGLMIQDKTLTLSIFKNGFQGVLFAHYLFHHNYNYLIY